MNPGEKRDSVEHSGRCGDGKEQLDLKYISQTEPTGSAVGLDVGFEIKRKGQFQDFGPELLGPCGCHFLRGGEREEQVRGL